MNKDPKKNEESNEDEKIERFFDEENYSTLIVNEKEFKSPKKARLEDLVELLTSDDREKKLSALDLLKNEKAKGLLIEAIQDTENEAHLAALSAACWESGLDFSEHLLMFTELLTDSDYLTAIEAATVIENMEGKIDEKQLEKSIELLKSAIAKKDEKMVLMSDVKMKLMDMKAQLKN